MNVHLGLRGKVDAMITWAVRLLLIVAGFLASWLVAMDAPNFGLVQGVIAIMLVVLIVYVLAFWPPQLTWAGLVQRLKGLRKGAGV